MRWWLLIVCLLARPAWAEEPLTLVGPGGEPVAVLPDAGQRVLLHFWASWCPECGDDITALQRAAAVCPVSRVRVILVNVGEGTDEISAFALRYRIELPVLRDPKGSVFKGLGGRGLPMNLAWSEAERRVDVGPSTAADWRQRLAAWGC
jgi:peroxiredoxin